MCPGAHVVWVDREYRYVYIMKTQFEIMNSNCLSAISCDRFNKNNEKQVETKDISLLLNPPPNLALLFNQFNNTS